MAASYVTGNGEHGGAIQACPGLAVGKAQFEVTGRRYGVPGDSPDRGCLIMGRDMRVCCFQVVGHTTVGGCVVGPAPSFNAGEAFGDENLGERA